MPCNTKSKYNSRPKFKISERTLQSLHSLCLHGTCNASKYVRRKNGDRKNIITSITDEETLIIKPMSEYVLGGTTYGYTNYYLMHNLKNSIRVIRRYGILHVTNATLALKAKLSINLFSVELVNVFPQHEHGLCMMVSAWSYYEE